MRNLILVVCLISLYSCNNKKGNIIQVKKESLIQTSIIENNSYSINKLDTLLKGVWAENKEDNALFLLDGQNIIYTEGTEPYSYKVVGDTVILNMEPIAKLFVIKVTKDSLWFTDNFNKDTTKLYRRDK